jgi:hypothetical protein
MARTSLTKDFKEFLQCLNAHGVRFLVIGGHAVGFHGYPRATADLDVWVDLDAKNAELLVRAFVEFGFDVPDLKKEMFLQKDRIIRMGIAPNRIEILTEIDGVTFAEAYPNRIEAETEGVMLSYISLPDLQKNKKASGRNKDLNDLENLPEESPTKSTKAPRKKR